MLGMKWRSWREWGPTPLWPQTTAFPPGAKRAEVPASFLPILGSAPETTRAAFTRCFR